MPEFDQLKRAGYTPIQLRSLQYYCAASFFFYTGYCKRKASPELENPRLVMDSEDSITYNLFVGKLTAQHSSL